MISAKSLAAALGLPSPTDEQVAVIEAPMEPVLVVAGAGAGKTETMASRVVWLVANQLAGPEEILGLTFTRKAASELGARIRRRLSMLAGSPALRTWDPGGTLAARLRSSDPEVSTYHAYAGRLIADYGLLLPVEPSSTLLSETELWQLAFSVVSNWTGELVTDKTPASVTEAVLSLYSELAEHLVDVSALETAGDTLYGLIDTLPKGPRQRAEPSQALRKIQTVIDERRQLVPLVVALGDEMRRQSALDFGSQMSMAARLVSGHPEVADSERASVRAVLLSDDELAAIGHALVKAAMAQLRHIVDQATDRQDQVAVDQPQAEQADQYAGQQHDRQPHHHRALGMGADDLGLLGALGTQVADQRAHLFTGGAVHALDRGVSGARVGAGGQVGIAALLVGNAELLVFLTQVLDTLAQRRVTGGLGDQPRENALYIALPILELAPIFLQVLRLLAAQQHVFPFLHLHLELQVGLIDQL